MRGTEMNGFTVQEVFHRFYSAYRSNHAVSAEQEKAAFCIMNCKTGKLGANVSVCEECGCVQIHYNSCRNRCCPMCQELPKLKWIDARKEDVLDAPYFHVVFTIPEELNPVIFSNQRLLYDAMYHATSATLLELCGSPKHLGAKVGFISILHTWGSAMNYHPHIHVILLGGGLDQYNQWRDRGGKFFLPVKILSKLFRGKYMAELKSLWADAKLQFYGTAMRFQNHYEFQDLIDICYSKEWVPYCKPSFNGAQSVINYLGKYTHRIAISNYRIISIDEENVAFSVKDYKNAGRWKTMQISGIEFIRRFLMHVPQKGFVRIRHYGLLSSRCKAVSLSVCRNALNSRKYKSLLKNLNVPDMLETLFGKCKCKECGGILKLKYSRIHLRI